MLHFNINYQPLTQNKSGEKEKGIWLITHTHTHTGQGEENKKENEDKISPLFRSEK